jgi:flagellar motor protein MotB
MSRPGQRRREPASHADDWLMTYADTITLLLCLFVVFAIVSGSKQALQQKAPPLLPEVTAQMPPAAPQPHEAAAPQPAVAPAALAQSRLPVQEGEQQSARTKDAAPPAATASDAPPFPAREAATVGVSPVKADDAASRTLAGIPPPELVGSPTAPVPAPATVAAAVAAPKGDRITTLDMGSAAFFDSGSASLSDAGKAILQGVLPRLAAALGEGYRIKVEGHTDDTPIDTAQFPSNWELSSARASAVVLFFIEQGIPAPRLRAIGYADTEPEVPNRDAAGNALPANQARNRRVIIKLEKIETPAR